MPGDESGLVLQEEPRVGLVLAIDTRIAAAADDNGRGRTHSARMPLDALTDAGDRLAVADGSAPQRGGGAAARSRFRLSPRGRRWLLTAHIVTGVGLLGTVAAVLAIDVRAATTADADLAAAAYELLAMFTVLFGIPLSLSTLASGIVLGLGSKWGVLRYPWVVAKLALLVGVILVGALVLGPGTDAMRGGEGGAELRLVAGSAYDVTALLLSTGLSVFKPGRRRRPRSGG